MFVFYRAMPNRRPHNLCVCDKEKIVRQVTRVAHTVHMSLPKMFEKIGSRSARTRGKHPPTARASVVAFLPVCVDMQIPNARRKTDL